jgi:hypothetical protein
MQLKEIFHLKSDASYIKFYGRIQKNRFDIVPSVNFECQLNSFLLPNMEGFQLFSFQTNSPRQTVTVSINVSLKITRPDAIPPTLSPGQSEPLSTVLTPIRPPSTQFHALSPISASKNVAYTM